LKYFSLGQLKNAKLAVARTVTPFFSMVISCAIAKFARCLKLLEQSVWNTPPLANLKNAETALAGMELNGFSLAILMYRGQIRKIAKAF
jgi:hypothetical protein